MNAEVFDEFQRRCVRLDEVRRASYGDAMGSARAAALDAAAAFAEAAASAERGGVGLTLAWVAILCFALDEAMSAVWLRATHATSVVVTSPGQAAAMLRHQAREVAMVAPLAMSKGDVDGILREIEGAIVAADVMVREERSGADHHLDEVLAEGLVSIQAMSQTRALRGRGRSEHAASGTD